jgi:AcrR family transcriptional regulator
VATDRLPLNRDRVLRTAVDLADSSGVEALTMRRLGDELGFEAMSLYRHVASKQDLLNGMLDLVLAEWQLPVRGGDWQAAVRTSASSVHEALRRHPWAARLLMTGSHIRPERLRYMEALLARLRDAGFDAAATYHVYHLLDGYIFGFSLPIATSTSKRARIATSAHSRSGSTSSWRASSRRSSPSSIPLCLLFAGAGCETDERCRPVARSSSCPISATATSG